VRLWDLATGPSQTVAEHGRWINALVVTPDGRKAVTGSDEGTVRVWEVATGHARAMFHADNPVISCAVSADGRILAGGDTSGQVHFLQLEGGSAWSGRPKAPR
jgi:WD40 repeat protein